MIELVALAEAVQSAPADVERLYQSAVAARLDGRNAQAVATFEQVLAQQPDHVDARLNLGLSLMALDRLDEAEAAFNQVLVRSPAYVDARVGLAQVARRRGQTDEARRQVAIARSQDSGRADVQDLYRSLRETRTRIDIDVGQSSLSSGLPDWSEQRVGITHSPSGPWTFGAAVERTERFELQDVLLEATAARRLSRGHLYATVSGAPDADYRPELALNAGGAWALGGGWEATLDGSVARYPVGTVKSVQPGLALSLAGDRLRLAGRWIQTWDETDASRSGYALSGTWAISERLRLRADYADAPESSEGVTVDVRGGGLGLELDLNARISLRAGLLGEDRGPVERTAFNLGLGWRY